jgi:hypothetical protein
VNRDSRGWITPTELISFLPFTVKAVYGSDSWILWLTEDQEIWTYPWIANDLQMNFDTLTPLFFPLSLGEWDAVQIIDIHHHHALLITQPKRLDPDLELLRQQRLHILDLERAEIKPFFIDFDSVEMPNAPDGSIGIDVEDQSRGVPKKWSTVRFDSSVIWWQETPQKLLFKSWL